MLFTSVSFYLFAALAVVIARQLPWKTRRWFLIAASYVFYGAAEPWYCAILFASTLVDFVVARRIFHAPEPRTKWRWLLVSLICNLSLLCLFKYANFGVENLNSIFGMFGISELSYLDLVLPIGISFYTFQTMSYTIDVYRGKQKPTDDVAAFMLYVAFFPQLVAGPIERAKHLLTQFETGFRASRADIEYGVQRILWGVAKKVIIADRFAIAIQGVFLAPDRYSATEVILATLCFSFQLYLDFSAYTDIAIGLASLFGIRLNENFNYPFLARNPSDFWSRWHITLTNWFRDYVFLSLGGTRRGAPARTALSILIVMGLMGLWHGAEWHYVVFGLLSGLMVVVYITFRLGSGRRRLLGDSILATVVSILIMNVVINLIMIFFRARDVPTALQMIATMFNGDWSIGPQFYLPTLLLVAVVAGHFVLGAMAVSPISRAAVNHMGAIKKGLLCATLFLAINYLATNYTEQFLYFRF